MRALLLTAATLTLLVPPASAQDASGHEHAGTHGEPTAAASSDHTSPYAGLEAREVASLSPEDVAALRRGEGWSLALPAELNGQPGPAHLLELQKELGLDAEQVAALQAMRDTMQFEAITAGEHFIAAEAALDAAFREASLDEARLRDLVATAEAARVELRFVHLSRHLATSALLSPGQVEGYRELRGYSPRPSTP